MKVFQLSKKPNIKFKRAKKERKKKQEQQLPLFSQEAKVIQLYENGIFEEALRLDEEGNPKAKNLYLRAIEENDYPADAYCNIGIIESEEGNYTKAFNYFLSSLRLEPSHPETHFNIGNLYFEFKDYQLAKLHYEIAIEMNNNFPNPYFNLGLTYIQLQDFASAERYLEFYTKLVPHDEAEPVSDILSQLKSI